MKDLPIMAVGEIARRLDVSAGWVHQLVRTDPTFPAAWVQLGVGKVWRTEDVETWIQAREAKAKERSR